MATEAQQQHQPTGEEDFSSPYDSIAETDGEHPLVDEKMQKILAELLDAEADALGADLREFTADFCENPFDEEEFMSHIPYPNMIEGGYEDPALNPPEEGSEATLPPQQQQPKQEQKPKGQQQQQQKKQQQDQPKKQQPQQQQQNANANANKPKPPKQQQQQQAPVDDNDGFVTVGKGGKALKNKKNQKNLKAQKAILNGGDDATPKPNNSNNNNKNNNKKQQQQQQQQSSAQPQEQQVFESHKAALAEQRPKMPGQGEFPFCFVCAKRHDFGECQ